METAHHDLERREMLAEIRKLCKPDNVTNWFVLGFEYLFFVVVVALCVGSYHWLAANGHSLWWMLPIYAATALAIGGWTQNRLAVLIHESSHYLLFKNRVLNDVAGNLLVAFPLFAALGNYREGHWTHHRHVNDPEHDPDLKRLGKHHPRDFPIGKWRFLWEYVLLQALPNNAISYLKGRAAYIAKPVSDHGSLKNAEVLSRPMFRTLRIGYVVVLIAALTWFGWWPHYLLLWVVPMISIYPAMLFLREIAHHGNYPDNGDFTNSRVYMGMWLERQVFFPFNEQNHVLHHMFPTIPWHKSLAAHDVMMRYRPYRENVVICDGFFVKGSRDNDYPTVLNVLAAPSHAYLRGRNHGEQMPNGIRQLAVEEVGSGDGIAESWRAGES
jgi:fatty acid desaturase